MLSALLLVLAARGAAAQGPVIPDPGDLLISDTGGILWTFDVETDQLTDYQLPFGGNFDIQYSGPERIVIANPGRGEIWELDLSTGDLALVTDDPALRAPIGVAVDLGGGGTYYIADGESGVLAYDVQTDTMRVVIGPSVVGDAPDGIALDRDGRILFTNGSGRVYRISPDGASPEVLVDVGPFSLNGLVITPAGGVLVVSFDPGAVFSIDPETGDFSTLYEGPPLRDPEDVAIAPNGDIYISDTDFQRQFPDFVPALYRIPEGTSTLETLYAGAPLEDPVDILSTASQPSEAGGADRPETSSSVPAPNDLSTEPEVVGTNVVLTMIVLLVLLFTSTLFNSTLSKNRPEIEASAARFTAPFRRLGSAVKRRWRSTDWSRPWMGAVGAPVAILALTGLIYSLNEPGFGLNEKSLVLFFGFLLAIGAITYVYYGGQALFTRRRFRIAAGLRVFPVALAIAAILVFMSRLAGFDAPVVYGLVASYTLLVPASLDRRQDGQVVLFPAFALLALSLLAWVLLIPLREASEGSDSLWLTFPSDAAAILFVAGIGGLLFSMIPVSFMDGAKLLQWSRPLWSALFGAAAFVFVWTIMNPAAKDFDAVAEGRTITMLSFLALYSLLTLSTWAYFQLRAAGGQAPADA